MIDKTRQFYDELAEDYHMIFPDWQQSMEWQGEVLDTLIRAELGLLEGTVQLLDCAAGIGTQAIALAKHGYQVHATDLSPIAIQRASEEARQAGVNITTGVADMRTLSKQVTQSFDVIIAFDNALPHLLTDNDLEKALLSIKSKLKPGGIFLASIRDYDSLLEDKPRFTNQRVMGEESNQRITFQIWDWHDDGETYTISLFILTQRQGEWHTQRYSTDYRALKRATLTRLLSITGYINIHWEMEAYYQPVVIATSPIAAS